MNSLCSSCRALVLRPTRVIQIPTRTQFTIRTFTTSHQYAAPKAQAADKTTAARQKKTKAAQVKASKRKKKHSNFKLPDLKDMTRYCLTDAMRYLQAFEVGRDASAMKYDLAIRLKTKKDGPVLRNTIRLPHAVKTDVKVCVIVDPNSKQGKAAKEAGAALVGEDEVFEIIKGGKIDFDRCITTPESLPKMMRAGLPRILGPRGLMPSVKLGTVTENVVQSVKGLLGGSTYRERQGIVRMAVGQLAFSPEKLRDNVQALIAQLRREGAQMLESQGFSKVIHEVVLSSTNGPGFTLNGEFRPPAAVTEKDIALAAARNLNQQLTEYFKVHNLPRPPPNSEEVEEDQGAAEELEKDVAQQLAQESVTPEEAHPDLQPQAA